MTMLDRMRRHQSWLKWLLALVVLAFVAFYARDFVDISTTISGTAVNEVVASVEGQDITAGEFQRRYQQQIQAYQGAYGAGVNEQMLRQLGVDQQILQQMVDEQAAYAEAARQGIVVSDDELAQAIFAIPGLQENGRFIGEQRYEQLLRSQVPPLTKTQFEENMRHGMMIDRLRGTLTDWMAISEADLRTQFTRKNEKVKLSLVMVGADGFRDKVTVGDADLTAYYDAHKDTYRKAEQRKVRYLLIDRDQIHARTTVAPNDIQQSYDQNITQYQTPEQIRASHILLKTEGKDDAAVKKQAEALLAQARGGADFADLAKKFSEDDGSKANGGDLDYFARGRMVPEFETAAFALQAGQISDLVKSQFGYHIIKLVDRKAASTRPLEEVRATIQDQIAWQRTDQQIADRVAVLDARIDDPADLDAVAKESGLTVQESGLFTREDPVPGLGAAPQLAAAAFTLADKAVSKATTTPRGPVYFTVTGKKEPYVPAFDEVKDRVREDVVRTKAEEMAQQKAAQVAAALKSAKDFAAAVKAQGLSAKDTTLITRESPLPDVGTSAAVDDAAFALPVGGVSDPVAVPNGAAVVKVLERDGVTDDEYRLGKEAFRDELLNERRTRFFTAYMTKAKQKMKIEVRPDVVKKVLGA